MNVTIFQTFNNIEPFFWTKNQISKINLNPDIKEDINFVIEDVNYKWKYLQEHHFANFNFNFEDGINIIVIHEKYYVESFKDFINGLLDSKNSNKVFFIVFTKLIEDYWVSYDHRHDENFLKKISDAENVKIIWDIPFYKLKNFIFSPKIQIQSYFLNERFNGDIYFWGRDVFLNYPKKYRIGLHINKISGALRFNIVNKFKTYSNKYFYYTVNSDCPYNKRTDHGDLSQFTNFKSSIYTSKLMESYTNGVYNNWYISQFFELTINSQVEIVYETFPYFNNELWLIKWNEKTIKQLYLGKPFIHADPISHKLMYENEMKPYKPLYSDKLWNIYENWDVNVKNKYEFVDILKENIEWLCNMDENEWSERINLAMDIAKYNKNKVDELIFNTSLIDVVKSNL